MKIWIVKVLLMGFMLGGVLSSCAAFQKRENFSFINLEPGTPEFYEFIAQSYYQRREYRQAIVYYEEIVRRFSEKSKIYDTELAWAEYEIAFCYYKLNEFEEAYLKYQAVVSQYNDLGATTLASQRIRALEKRFPALVEL